MQKRLREIEDAREGTGAGLDNAWAKLSAKRASSGTPVASWLALSAMVSELTLNNAAASASSGAGYGGGTCLPTERRIRP